MATAQVTSSSSWCTNRTNPPSYNVLSCGVSSQSQDNIFHHGMHRFTEAIELAKYDNLTPFDVKGDDACLFRAIQFGRSGSKDGYLKLRSDTVKYMREHEDIFREFVENDPGECPSFEIYLNKLARPHESVGECALRAGCNVIGLNVKVLL